VRKAGARVQEIVLTPFGNHDLCKRCASRSQSHNGRWRRSHRRRRRFPS
jgi:hypothetical protein